MTRVSERPPLDAGAIDCGVRRVDVTHDGRPIGFIEPLETERALRLAISRRVNFISLQKREQARESNRTAGRKISQAQKQSATKRAKGEGEMSESNAVLRPEDGSKTTGVVAAEKAVDHTPSMVERVARAICGKNCDMPRCSCQPDAHSKSTCRAISFAMARRAIQAMGTPTERMYQANDQALHNAKKQLGWSKRERNARLAHRTKCALRWSAMIDAALKDGE